MTNSNPEVDEGGGEPEPVLRQEARKVLSGRVPLALSIGLALLSGMLVGYGVRALTAGQCGQRESRCARQTGARILVMPGSREELTDCKPRLHLLHDAEPGSAPPTAGSAEAPAGVKAPAGAEAPGTAKAPAARPADKPH